MHAAHTLLTTDLNQVVLMEPLTRTWTWLALGQGRRASSSIQSARGPALTVGVGHTPDTGAASGYPAAVPHRFSTWLCQLMSAGDQET